MNLRQIGLLWLCLIVPLSCAAAAPNLADESIRELARKWLVFNDGVGLSIGIYANGQRQFYNFGTTRLDGNKVPTERHGLRNRRHRQDHDRPAAGARHRRGARARSTTRSTKYLDEPYPNLENGGETVRLVHLANMTSQLADNIPDLTQVRMVPGEPLATTRMRVLEKYTRAEFLRQLHLRQAAARARHRARALECAEHAARRGAGEDLRRAVRDHPGARDRKAAAHGQRHAPPTKLLAQGYTKDNEELPPFSAPMQFASGSLRYSTEDLLRYASWQLVERDASVKLAHQPTWQSPDQRQGVAFYWIIRRIAARPPPALFGRDLWIREHVRSLPGGGGRGRPAV